MIKFFRKIRQNLLSEGKTGRYLKYAIGEIVLVVIGILIALQINTWNGNRKDRIYEKQALNEIFTSLKRDAEFNELIKTRIRRRDTAINYILSFLNSRKVETDSTFIYYLKESNLDIKINFDKGAYEALKSKGLEYIKNDSLRTLIVRVYEIGFSRTVFFADELRSGFIDEIKDILLGILLDLNVVPMDEKFLISECVTLNTTEKIIALKRLMYLQIQLSKEYDEMLSRQLSQINRLILPISKELDKLER